MDTLLERLSPPQIIALVSIVSGLIFALAMIYAITKYQFRVLSDQTALKREHMQGEATLRQKIVERGGNLAGGPGLDQLLKPEAVNDDVAALNADLATRFGSLTASPEEIERTLVRAMASGVERKRTIVRVLDELLDAEAPHEAILAAVRPLCDPAPVAERTPTSV